jgi:putative nucleotidyltransferase with HDIG domain
MKKQLLKDKNDSAENSVFIDKLLKTIGKIADHHKIEVYAVGGFVRDKILGIPIREIDFVVVGDGPDIAKTIMKKMEGTGWVSYSNFGTASFFWNNFKLEFVSARKEIYKNESRKPSVINTDLTTDLTRRDFTINTLAMGINKNNFGAITDPFNGHKDLMGKIIRTPLNPEETFSEDPLRIMRAARFASQLNFEIDFQTMKGMKNERERLRIVSQERITDELLKILKHNKPSIGFRILQKCKVLEIVFPELASTVGVEQRDTYHHKDVFDHTMKVVDNLAITTENLILRFTGLIHDIGKPNVKRFIEDIGWTFHGHETVGIKMLKNICHQLKLPNEFLKYSQKLTQLHMRPIQLIGDNVTDSAIRRLLFEAGDKIDDLMTLCRADITSGNPKRVEKYLINFNHLLKRMKEVEEKDRMRAFQSPVRGDEIIATCGIEPGPMVGKLKKIIEEAILDGKIPNEYNAAYEFLLKIKDDFIRST